VKTPGLAIDATSDPQHVLTAHVAIGKKPDRPRVPALRKISNLRLQILLRPLPGYGEAIESKPGAACSDKIQVQSLRQIVLLERSRSNRLLFEGM
jgi:hypothetical protein